METEHSDPAIKYSKCPTCGFATIYGNDQPAAQDRARIVDDAATIMDRARILLKRIRGSFPPIEGQAYAKEARLIVEAINDWKLKL